MITKQKTKHCGHKLLIHKNDGVTLPLTARCQICKTWWDVSKTWVLLNATELKVCCSLK